ncbi:MAG: phosphotransferase family protein [Mycobacterium sp.]
MNTAALRDYLIGAGIDVCGELTADLISGGRSNLTFRVSDGVTAWVVRRPPVRGITPSAHDMGREYIVASALQGSAVPVAKTVAFDAEGTAFGVPMTVVEFVDGVVIRDQTELADLSDEQVDANASAIVKVLAALHAVPYDQIGLGKFGRPCGFLSRQVNLWARQWERVRTRDLPDVATMHTALAQAVPPASDASIVHGDLRIDNTIVDSSDPTVVRAVVDWEMSTIGDPLTDIALMCVYRDPLFNLVLGTQAAWTSPRLPSADTLAHRYAIASGRDLSNWNFYLALANFKLGVISEGITHRALQGSDAGDGAMRAADAAPEFIAAGLRVLRNP